MSTETLAEPVTSEPAVDAPREPSGRRRGRGRRLAAKILLGLAAVVAILAIVIAMQPSEFRVARSATMAAPASAVFAQVNDLHQWEAWSPWAKLDPAAENSFEGPTSGTGAILRWSGNSDVGAGSMTIRESQPHERIRIQLDFIRPFEGSSDVEFTFKEAGEQTEVTWSIAGQNNFVAKAIGLVIDCEKMIGDQFEQGLAGIKSIVEPAAAP